MMEEKIKSQNLAAIRVRGRTQINSKVESTLRMLRLYKNNYCSLVLNTPNYVGMLKKIKDYITWGEIDDETFELLVDKRAEPFNGREEDSKNKIKYNDYMVVHNKKIKKYFRLSPPRKGFERKGLKYSYQNGGALGYRGKYINDLIKRML